jgi:hypothetical protein
LGWKEEGGIQSLGWKQGSDYQYLGPIFSSVDYKGDVEIPDWDGKLEVTKRGARFSVWDRKRFVDEDGQEKELSQFGVERET